MHFPKLHTVLNEYVCVWTKAHLTRVWIEELMLQVSVKALLVNTAFINIVWSAWAELNMDCM